VSKPSPRKVHITDPWVTGARYDFGLDLHLARCLERLICLEFGLDRLEIQYTGTSHNFFRIQIILDRDRKSNSHSRRYQLNL
jgi:hypothetical protein